MANPSISVGDVRVEAMNEFLRRVYHWMAAGLILTAVTAQVVASTPSLIYTIFSSRGLVIGLVIAELGLVMFLGHAINRIGVATAMGLFILYCLLNGVTLSVILLVYTGESVASAFLTTAGMFGAMSVYGLYTKRDLTSLRSFFIMGLWGLIIAGLVNMFIGSGMLGLVISVMGVLVFLGLTAYDTQRLRELGGQVDVEGDDMGRKLAIFGALHLYLDFVNMFLYLLRIFGKRR
ncbi:MAG: Bax inhibitor-1/YccA family protein [Synergistaceae bacterium]|jgi:FtsH-binding integral membrane protein|nr:Bax inhibitor-1/YccA family protein [Synergistaceae bacterium]